MIHLLITASIPETVVSYLHKHKTVLHKTDDLESVYQELRYRELIFSLSHSTESEDKFNSVPLGGIKPSPEKVISFHPALNWTLKLISLGSQKLKKIQKGTG